MHDAKTTHYQRHPQLNELLTKQATTCSNIKFKRKCQRHCDRITNNRFLNNNNNNNERIDTTIDRTTKSLKLLNGDISSKDTDDESHAMLGNPNQLTTSAAITNISIKATTEPTTTNSPLILIQTSEATPKASNTPNNLIGKMINDVSKTINCISVRKAAPATTTATTTTTINSLPGVGTFQSFTNNADSAAAAAAVVASATDVSKTSTEITMLKAGLMRTTATATTTKTTTKSTTTITSEGELSPSPPPPVSKLTTIQKKITTNDAMQNCLEPVRPTRAISTENKCPSKELTQVSIQRELEPISRKTRQRRTFAFNNNDNNVGTSTQNKWIKTTTDKNSIRCEPLEPERNILLGLQTHLLASTKVPSLAERKAKLKSDFFKDTNSDLSKLAVSNRAISATNQPDPAAPSHIELPKRLLRKNTSNLRLNIVKHKEIYYPKLEISTPSSVLTHVETTANEQISLVAQRKLDLKRRFEQPALLSSTHLAQATSSFPRVEQLVQKFDINFRSQPTKHKMIVNTDKLTTATATQESKEPHATVMFGQLKPDSVLEQRNSPLSDEGCNLGQSPYSSDNDDNESIRTTSTTIERCSKRKDKVARSASSDSALGLEVDDSIMDSSAAAATVAAPSAQHQQKRRMTLTVTDLPLRPALLPLAEPTALPDSPTTGLQQTLQDLIAQSTVPSKVLLEERVVEIPEDPRSIGCSLSSSRRESAQSCISDYPPSECGGVRFVRTPSVVVSDYSDDVMCGITLEEIEYFRAQRMRRRRSSLDTSGGTEKEGGDGHSDVSASSSCSNLYYCGSTISALDGAECYVNGMRLPLERKTSDCSTCSAISGEEEDAATNFTIPEQPEDPCQMGKDLADLLAAQHLTSKRAKKVGLTASLMPLGGGDGGVEKTDM